MYDPLMYVLIFPFWDKGWEKDYQSQRKQYTPMQYYRYRLMVRGDASFNTLHRMGRLFQQHIVDMYAKIEGECLKFPRKNQSQLQAELCSGLADAVQSADGHIEGLQIGKRIILPSTFTGGARYQHQLYQDAMGIVHCFGKPDFFITFTCNPRWKKITDELLENQSQEHHPDIISRVFKLELHSLLQDLYYGATHVFVEMIALIYVIEWQKQGPPHAHILAISHPDSKPRTPKDYDMIVCAEIPDEHQFPELLRIVTKLLSMWCKQSEFTLHG